MNSLNEVMWVQLLNLSGTAVDSWSVCIKCYTHVVSFANVAISHSPLFNYLPTLVALTPVYQVLRR